MVAVAGRSPDSPAWWVRINSAGRTACSPTWHWHSQLYGHQDYDLWMVVRGRGTMVTPEGRVPLMPGACFLLRGGDSYEGLQDPANRLEVIHIHFDFLATDGSLLPRRWVEERFPLQRVLRDLPLMIQLTQRVVDHWRADERETAETAAHWLRAALLELRSQDRQPTLTGPALERQNQLAAICARLRDDPGQPWRVADLAASVYLSADHFSRLFQAQTGQTPQAYRQRARLDKACVLLRFSGESVSQIAGQLGFVDAQHFGRFFRGRTGVSPGAYRRGEAKAPESRPEAD